MDNRNQTAPSIGNVFDGACYGNMYYNGYLKTFK